jgi:hypothetical protein
MTCFKRTVSLFLLLLVPVCSTLADSTRRTDPIIGSAYDSLIEAQDRPLQQFLDTVFPENGDYLVTGPLDALFSGPDNASDLYHAVRVICPNHESLGRALDAVQEDSSITITQIDRCLTSDCDGRPAGYRGAFVRFRWQGKSCLVQLNTVQQTRWLIWAHNVLKKDDPTIPREKLDLYARALSDHLYAVDRKWEFIPEPKAADFGLPERYDIYCKPPDSVIPGYEDYRNFLRRHAGINTEFARGILSFVPTDSLLRALKDNAPREAYRNKEAQMLQHEYREFFKREGNVRVMKTLIADAFDTLKPAEYFFAVGLSGRIRFAREILGEEARLIEVKTGQKSPRANRAFLFPGEPVLTAGAFFIECDSTAYIARVNALSGRYFYSNITPTVREDIAVESNRYVLSLGHFFRALDKLNIPYGGIIISKF